MYAQSPEAIQTSNPDFLASTMGFFALALLITGSGTFAGFYLWGSNPELFNNPMIFYGAIVVELILVFTSHTWSQRLPMGYLMFALFALLSGFTMVPILAFAGAAGGAAMIGKALFSSVAVFLAAALYGWTTHRNLLGMGGFLMMALIGVIILGILGIFFPWGNTMEIIVSGFAVLLFAGFAMYDMQRIKGANYLNPLVAAIGLYLSFINIFISILRLMIAMGGRD